MDEPSRTARDVLATYRRSRTLSGDAHARVQTRLASSIQGRVRDRDVELARIETRRRIVVAGVVALAAAAAIVLLVRALQPTPARPAGVDDRGEAPYERRDDDGETPSEHRAPPATDTGPAAASVALQPSVERTDEKLAPRPISRVASPTSPIADASLAEELAIVRRARAALDRGEPDSALAAIAEHERRFAAGQLVEERKSLRIEALCRAGKAVQARAEAATFLREHPSSAHADRVRSACAEP